MHPIFSHKGLCLKSLTYIKLITPLHTPYSYSNKVNFPIWLFMLMFQIQQFPAVFQSTMYLLLHFELWTVMSACRGVRIQKNLPRLILEASSRDRNFSTRDFSRSGIGSWLIWFQWVVGVRWPIPRPCVFWRTPTPGPPWRALKLWGGLTESEKDPKKKVQSHSS